MPTAVYLCIQSLWNLLKHADPCTCWVFRGGFIEDLCTFDSVLSPKRWGNVKGMGKKVWASFEIDDFTLYPLNFTLFLGVISCPSDASNAHLDLSESEELFLCISHNNSRIWQKQTGLLNVNHVSGSTDLKKSCAESGWTSVNSTWFLWRNFQCSATANGTQNWNHKNSTFYSRTYECVDNGLMATG